MSLYYPDKWSLIKIQGKDPHYRVFGSWSGGYLSGDSWRMNSGIVRVEETDDTFKFFGSSGSCYECSKEMYGFNAYGFGVAKSYEEKLGSDFSILNEEEALSIISKEDWIINE
jgi:hypothetical protein